MHNISDHTLNRLKRGEVFLENSTGDIYSFDHSRNEFYPVANVGIHNNKAAQEKAKKGGVMLKSYTYIAKVFDEATSVYTGKASETLVHVFKPQV